MTREQMIAWLTLEGWEPRWFVRSGGPTLYNAGYQLWVGHLHFKARPLADHPEGDKPTLPADWSQVNKNYMDRAFAKLIGEQS